MLPICGKPVLQHQIECLKRQGITEITLAIGHLGEQISSYFGDGSSFGVQIDYIEEKEPLGTAGALYYLKGKVTEDFLLINGDLIFDVDFQHIVFPVDPNLYVICLSVADGVCHGLLHDAVDNIFLVFVKIL